MKKPAKYIYYIVYDGDRFIMEYMGDEGLIKAQECIDSYFNDFEVKRRNGRLKKGRVFNMRIIRSSGLEASDVIYDPGSLSRERRNARRRRWEDEDEYEEWK